MSWTTFFHRYYTSTGDFFSNSDAVNKHDCKSTNTFESNHRLVTRMCNSYSLTDLPKSLTTDNEQYQIAAKNHVPSSKTGSTNNAKLLRTDSKIQTNTQTATNSISAAAQFSKASKYK